MTVIALKIDIGAIVEVIGAVADKLINVDVRVLRSDAGIAVDIDLGLGQGAAELKCVRYGAVNTGD